MSAVLDALPPSAPTVLRFGPLRLDLLSSELSGPRGQTLLQARPAAILRCLLEEPSTMVSAEELLVALAPERATTPARRAAVLGGAVLHTRLHLATACGRAVRISEGTNGYTLTRGGRVLMPHTPAEEEAGELASY